MSKQYNVEIHYSATVVVRINAKNEEEAKGLTERYSMYESTVLMGYDEGHAETITYDPSISVRDIQEYTTPDQFQPERREPLDLKLLEMLKYILHTEVGEWSSNYDWQEHWGLSDEQFKQIRNAVDRLQLSDQKGSV